MAQGKKFVIAAPGIPPIFASAILYVADKEGFFKKYGANVEVRPFDTGTAASRAVISGDIEMSLSPSALLISQISNANAPVVGDLRPGAIPISCSARPIRPRPTARTSSGRRVGVDAIGGARSIALRTMLTAAATGVKIEDVQQVAARLERRARHDRRPAEIRRAASRRRRRPSSCRARRSTRC